MTRHDTQFADPTLQHQLDLFLADPKARITQIKHRDERYWAKKCETLSLRWRIQKGDPKLAFEADRTGHHALSDAGVPVPEIVAEGENYIVTKDSGETLSHLLVQQTQDPSARIAAFTEAGRQLARMHAKGLTHGRPAIKDMCWDGTNLVFLDFERYSPTRNTPKGHMQDLIIMIHSCYAFLPEDSPEADAAAAAYRRFDETGTWDRASAWCRKMRWIDVVTKPLQWGNRAGAMEFKAIPFTLKSFGVS
ncbi:hypothetical protein [Aliiroseovarius sp. 2305UL8-7]|uniref:hypothetical protein n=1 Tax=Aliiroseovarius conchicola TaxID=3121637 RepID=UPI00352957B7